MTSDCSAQRCLRYDDSFVLNMSSAAKIERIVDKVESLSAERFPSDMLSENWIADMIAGFGSSDDDCLSYMRSVPFFPFRVLLVTGTAGAGKTSSIQTLAANLNCVISATTVIAAQNLSSVLNRTRSSQVKTIYRIFGFNSKHVSMADSLSQPEFSPSASGRVVQDGIENQQRRDLFSYRKIIEDIVVSGGR